jgi:cell division protein FtsW (lipid II flippase)
VGHTLKFFVKQSTIAMTAIFFAMLIYLFWKIKWIDNLFMLFYLIVLGLLIYVLKSGLSTHGAQRLLPVNLSITTITIQPSLLARLVLVVLFAKVIYKRKEYIASAGLIYFFWRFFPIVVYSGIYYYLIYKENHLSSILTSAFTLIALLFLANFRKATIIMLIALVLMMGFFVVKFQKEGSFRTTRLQNWKNSSLIIRWMTGNTDNGNIHKNNLESILCLTTGKLAGVSPDGGMGKLGYLHEAKTDFVYAIIAEEFGLLGALLVLILYMVIVFRGMSISSKQTELFNKLLGYGFSLNLFFNVIIHIGTVTSCFPTTGVTLPFISHGGSSLIANSLAIGVLLKLARTQETSDEAYSY